MLRARVVLMGRWARLSWNLTLTLDLSINEMTYGCSRLATKFLPLKQKKGLVIRFLTAMPGVAGKHLCDERLCLPGLCIMSMYDHAYLLTG